MSFQNRYISLYTYLTVYCIAVWNNGTIIDTFESDDEQLIKAKLLQFRDKHKIHRLKNTTNLKV